MTDRIEDLAQRITQADFIAAIRLLERAAPDKPRLGRASRLRDEPVRLSQKQTLGFKNNQLEQLEQTNSPHPYRLYVNFMGLFGSNGPLPLHLTEHSMQRAQHHNDPTFGEFVDLFNHRMLSLFYLAMAEADPVVNMDHTEDNRYTEFVSAIAGFLPSAASHRDSLSDESKLKYAAWLGARTRSPDGLASMLGECFGIACRIEEFVGDWLPIPEEGLLKLGLKEQNSELGLATYCGRRVWSITHKICICIGPLSWQDYSRFAPGAPWNQTLQDLVRTYLGDEIDWDLKLELATGQACRLQLDGSRRLGFNGWLFGSGSLEAITVSSTNSRQQLGIAYAA